MSKKGNRKFLGVKKKDTAADYPWLVLRESKSEE